MENVMTASNIWKESVLIYFDNAFSRGMNPEEILADVKKLVSETELGEMNFTLESVMQEWKEDRGIA